MPVFPSRSPPPGSSYIISNALIIAKRAALGLEDPIRIQDGEWKEGNSLYDWLRCRPRSIITCMQLRKEQTAPFFHEYVTFQLLGGNCYRVDRRQLPDERSPLDCAEEKGVEAYDTLEHISNLEDSTYGPSDCLCQLDFDQGVPINLLVDICRNIAKHKVAGVYTIQRYNCYFYAQTVILCALLRKIEWKGWRVCEPYLRQAYRLIYPDHKPVSRSKTGATWEAPLELINDRLRDTLSRMMHEPDIQGSTIGELQRYFSDMIQAHSVRVGQYKLLLKCTSEDVERDIKSTMDDIWKDIRFLELQDDFLW